MINKLLGLYKESGMNPLSALALVFYMVAITALFLVFAGNALWLILTGSFIKGVLLLAVVLGVTGGILGATNACLKDCGIIPDHKKSNTKYYR